MDTKLIRNLLQTLHSNTQQSPIAGSLPLMVGDSICGNVSPTAAQVLIKKNPRLVSDSCIRLDRTEVLSAEFEKMANCLFEAGCIPKWRNELLDVWQDDLSIAAIERGAVRPLGLLTRAVHLNAYSPDGKLWVARRALDKPTDPGMWDTLVGGLIGYREPSDLALARESLEEAGLSPEQITQREPITCIYRMKRQVPEGFQCEDVLTSDCILADGTVPANQDGEVMEIACLDVDTIQQMLLDDAFTIEASIVISQSLLTRAQH